MSPSAMIQKYETRAGLAPRRASGMVSLGLDTSEDSLKPHLLQARWLRSKLGLSAERAELLAGFIFEHGRAS